MLTLSINKVSFTLKSSFRSATIIFWGFWSIYSELWNIDVSGGVALFYRIHINLYFLVGGLEILCCLKSSLVILSYFHVAYDNAWMMILSIRRWWLILLLQVCVHNIKRMQFDGIITFYIWIWQLKCAEGSANTFFLTARIEQLVTVYKDLIMISFDCLRSSNKILLKKEKKRNLLFYRHRITSSWSQSTNQLVHTHQ